MGFGMLGFSGLWIGQLTLAMSQWSFVWAIIVSGFGS